MNAAALRIAERHLIASRPDAAVVRCRIDNLPPFSEDIEAAGWPGAVQRLRELVTECDALLISTPEYNGSVPGALKNALDWLSRPHRASPLSRKPVATMSASPSRFGAVKAQDHLRYVLTQCNVELIHADVVALPYMHGHSEISAELSVSRVEALVDVVVAYLDERRADDANQALKESTYGDYTEPYDRIDKVRRRNRVLPV